jgi:hypothetical protein
MYKQAYYKTSNDLDSNSQIPKSQLIEETYINQEIKPPSPKGPILNMKWDTVQYAAPSDPEVWGPSFWFILHNGSVNYPINASPLYAERMKGFILGIPVMIPCEKCSDHATAYIESNWRRINEIVSGRKKLFEFFCDFHNILNIRYRKPVLTYEDAYKLYTSRANVTKLSYSSNF